MDKQCNAESMFYYEPNRRLRLSTSGGVRGRGLVAPSYSIFVKKAFLCGIILLQKGCENYEKSKKNAVTDGGTYNIYFNCSCFLCRLYKGRNSSFRPDQDDQGRDILFRQKGLPVLGLRHIRHGGGRHNNKLHRGQQSPIKQFSQGCGLGCFRKPLDRDQLRS